MTGRSGFMPRGRMSYRTQKGRGAVWPDVIAAVLAVVGLAFGVWVVVANFHVIEGNTSLKAFTSQGAALVVENVVATDEPGDLALLKIKAKSSGGYPFLPLAQAAPAVGVRVYAIGNPLGYSNTLSEGLVSGFRKGRAARGEPDY